MLYFKLLPRVPALTSDTNGLQPGSQLNPSLLQLLLAMVFVTATDIKLGRKGMDNFQGVDLVGGSAQRENKHLPSIRDVLGPSFSTSKKSKSDHLLV